MINNLTLLNAINSPIRSFKAKVERYSGSALADTYNYNDDLIGYSIERFGDKTKMFGYLVPQKLKLELRDANGSIGISEGDSLKTYITSANEYVNIGTEFIVTEVNRDENTNKLTITAGDRFDEAKKHTVSELAMPETTTLGAYVDAAASKIGCTANYSSVDGFDLAIDKNANFEGTEILWDMLVAACEATQSICFLTTNNTLYFMRLDIGGSPVYTVTKSRYFTLETKDSKTLHSICHVTDLGDNVIAGSGDITQYVRSNPFWELREDVGDLLDAAISKVDGLTITQFNCSWRGNFLLEIGDKIEFETKGGGFISTYVLDDTISYNGSLSGTSSWELVESEKESATNPSTIGEALNQTYARVDKVNQRIDLVVKETKEMGEKVAQMEITTAGVVTRVEEVERSNEEVVDILSDTTTQVNNLTQKVGTLEVNTDAVAAEVSRVERETKETFTTINGEITGLDSRTTTLETDIASLKVTTEGIEGRVENLDQVTTEKFETLEDGMTTLTSKVETVERDMASLEVTVNGINGRVENLDQEMTENFTIVNGNISSLTDRTTTLETNVGTLDVETDNISAQVSTLQQTTTEKFDEVDGSLLELTDTVTSEIAALKINTNSISATVEELERVTKESFSNTNDSITELTNKVNASITADDVQIQIEKSMADGVNKVTTSTGFTFDDNGLNISKSDSEINTTITEDGMTVYKNDDKMLEANNQGVYALNLHATTYLVIGLHSRFEDYISEDNEQRTGCFWV